jgi:hypothetical protein
MRFGMRRLGSFVQDGMNMSRLVMAVGFAIVLSAAIADAQDDWQVIQRITVDHSDSSQAATPAHQRSGERQFPSAAGQEVFVCGERALPASPKVKAMISRINGVWGSDIQVYQSAAPEQPHAAPGGCIFYNTPAMTAILSSRLAVQDSKVVEPLLWAIMAHEVGHQVHNDFSSSRASIPDKTKELEADRFAGYTLEELNVRATDLTPYWTLTGDEFGSGPGYKHGTSEERVAAFKEGWHLAEWNRTEGSQSVQSALDEPVAPDSPDAAPQ